MNILNNGRFGMAAALSGTMKSLIVKAVSRVIDFDRTVPIQMIRVKFMKMTMVGTTTTARWWWWWRRWRWQRAWWHWWWWWKRWWWCFVGMVLLGVVVVVIGSRVVMVVDVMVVMMVGEVMVVSIMVMVVEMIVMVGRLWWWWGRWWSWGRGDGRGDYGDGSGGSGGGYGDGGRDCDGKCSTNTANADCDDTWWLECQYEKTVIRSEDSSFYFLGWPRPESHPVWEKDRSVRSHPGKACPHDDVSLRNWGMNGTDSVARRPIAWISQNISESNLWSVFLIGKFKHQTFLIHGRQPRKSLFRNVSCLTKQHETTRTANSHFSRPRLLVKHVNACALIAIPK